MIPIQGNITQFKNALASGAHLSCDRKGHWSNKSSCCIRVVERLFPLVKDFRFTRIARSFSNTLDTLERTRVEFEGTQLSKQFKEMHKPEEYIQAGKLLIASMHKVQTVAAKQALIHLERRVLALQYRCEDPSVGGLKPVDEPPADLYDRLELQMTYRKRQQLLAEPDKMLTDEDRQRIRTLSRFTELTKLILTKTELLDLCFHWIIRQRLPAQVYAEFPFFYHRVRDNLLSGRLAYYEGQGIRVSGDNHINRDRENTSYKDLQLLFEWRDNTSRWQSMLDDTALVHLKENYTLSISEVFSIFSKKNDHWGNIEMSAKGIANWHTAEMGRWNGRGYTRINFDDAQWWNALPAVKHLTAAEARERYGEIANGVNWLERHIATRRFVPLVLPGAHAFTMIGVPTADGGYDFHTFGKSTIEKDLPRTWKAKAKLIGSTLSGAVISPDPSGFESRRQCGGSVHKLTPEQGLQKMNKIRQSILNGFNGVYPYQVLTANCAIEVRAWKIEGPDNLFQASFYDCVPPFPINHLFNFIKKCPRCIQRGFFWLFFRIFGGGSHRPWAVDNQLLQMSVMQMKPWEWPYSPYPGRTFCMPAKDQRLFEQGNLYRVFPTASISGGLPTSS